jgi:hypothetical protein
VDAQLGTVCNDSGGTGCNGTGACVKSDGVPCGGDSECLTDHCVNGVCCNSACAGTCVACIAALTGGQDGLCGNIPQGNPAPTGQCPVATCGNDGSCDGNAACEQVPNSTPCGADSCNGDSLVSSTCVGGTCTPSTGSCSNAVKCVGQGTCPACTQDSDCDSLSDYCDTSSGTCVGMGGPGAVCAGADQCTSGLCGAVQPYTSGSFHCCVNTCPASVAACGATDCDGYGACNYPGNTVAPASLRTSGDCQQVVCDGSGGDTTIDDATNLPTSPSACLIDPACCGPSPLTPCFTDAPTDSSCTTSSDPNALVCGDTSNLTIAGTCVECNNTGDCVAIGKTTCNTSTGVCS